MMNRDGSGDQDDVVKWLGLAVGLHEDVVTEATPRLRSEQVYVVLTKEHAGQVAETLKQTRPRSVVEVAIRPLTALRSTPVKSLRL